MSTQQKEQKMSTKVQEFKSDEVVTPVALANSIGVPPQMIYSYLKAGRIKGVEGKIEGRERVQKLILVQEANEWVEAYQTRKEERALAREVEALEAEQAETVDA
jgi:hypothetical protein